VCAAWVEGERTAVPTRIRWSRFLTQHAGQRVDLDVECADGPRVVGFRIVVLPGREAAMTRLCTNLSRTPFSIDVVGRLYRCRWQIERCFKDGSRTPTSTRSIRRPRTSRQA
jgi:IS4 transposase